MVDAPSLDLAVKGCFAILLSNTLIRETAASLIQQQHNVLSMLKQFINRAACQFEKQFWTCKRTQKIDMSYTKAKFLLLQTSSIK